MRYTSGTFATLKTLKKDARDHLETALSQQMPPRTSKNRPGGIETRKMEPQVLPRAPQMKSKIDEKSTPGPNWGPRARQAPPRTSSLSPGTSKREPRDLKKGGRGPKPNPISPPNVYALRGKIHDGDAPTTNKCSTKLCENFAIVAPPPTENNGNNFLLSTLHPFNCTTL